MFCYLEFGLCLVDCFVQFDWFGGLFCVAVCVIVLLVGVLIVLPF